MSSKLKASSTHACRPARALLPSRCSCNVIRRSTASPRATINRALSSLSGSAPYEQGEAGPRITSGRPQPTPAQLATLAQALPRSRRRVVVAGEMREGERLAPALVRLGFPVLAEPGSQLRRGETGGAVE